MPEPKEILEGLLTTEGVESAFVAGSDGFVIDFATAKEDADMDYLSAAITEKLGGVDKLAEDIGMKGTPSIMVEFDDGVLLAMPISEDALLGVICRSAKALGILRYRVKKAVKQLAESL